GQHHAPARRRVLRNRAGIVEVQLDVGRLLEARAVRDHVGGVALVPMPVGADADAAVAAEGEADRERRRRRRATGRGGGAGARGGRLVWTRQRRIGQRRAGACGEEEAGQRGAAAHYLSVGDTVALPLSCTSIARYSLATIAAFCLEATRLAFSGAR